MGKDRDAMQSEMRLRGLAPRTQQSYAGWMQRLVLRVGVPAEQITEQQARGYLSELSGRGLSASTINQAINAIRFFFGRVLHRSWQWEVNYQRAPQRLPVTLTPEETSRLLAALGGHFKTGHHVDGQDRPPQGSDRDWVVFTS